MLPSLLNLLSLQLLLLPLPLPLVSVLVLVLLVLDLLDLQLLDPLLLEVTSVVQPINQDAHPKETVKHLKSW